MLIMFPERPLEVALEQGIFRRKKKRKKSQRWKVCIFYILLLRSLVRDERVSKRRLVVKVVLIE